MSLRRGVVRRWCDRCLLLLTSLLLLMTWPSLRRWLLRLRLRLRLRLLRSRFWNLPRPLLPSPALPRLLLALSSSLSLLFVRSPQLHLLSHQAERRVATVIVILAVVNVATAGCELVVTMLWRPRAVGGVSVADRRRHCFPRKLVVLVLVLVLMLVLVLVIRRHRDDRRSARRCCGRAGRRR